MVCIPEQTSHDPMFALLALVLGSTVAWLVGNLQLENIEFVEFFHGIWSDYVISSWKWILGSTKKHYVRGAVQRPSSLHTMKQGKKQSNDKSNRDRLRSLPTKEGLALWQQVAAVSERSIYGNTMLSFLLYFDPSCAPLGSSCMSFTVPNLVAAKMGCPPILVSYGLIL
jgi:hypothetical protein